MENIPTNVVLLANALKTKLTSAFVSSLSAILGISKSFRLLDTKLTSPLEPVVKPLYTKTPPDITVEFVLDSRQVSLQVADVGLAQVGAGLDKVDHHCSYNNIRIVPYGSNTIQNSDDLLLNIDGSCIVIYSNGNDWYIK